MSEVLNKKLLLCAAAAILVLRCLTLGSMSLIDTTEGRYGSIAKIMYESGDYVTPRIIYRGEKKPYWSKPPLHLWLIAASYKITGVNEVGSRVPGVLSALVVCIFTFLFASSVWGREIGYISTLVLSTTVLFFVIAGTCIFDMTLAAAVACALASFPLCVEAGSRHARVIWGYMFFTALAAGMLVKGPVALVLSGGTLFLWLLWSKKWRYLKFLPWGFGSFLFLLLSLPWYAAAERATPGFLRYFILNEHIYRYLIKQYGDMYGHGHVEPYGYIWLMMLGSFMPWTLALAVPALRYLKQTVKKDNSKPPVNGSVWVSYAFLWGVFPAVFFTFARQVIPTYVLPGLAGLSVLCGVWLHKKIKKDAGAYRTFRVFAVILTVLAFAPVAAAFYLKTGSLNLVLTAAGAVVSLALCRAGFRSKSLGSLFLVLTTLIAVIYSGGYLAAGDYLSLRRSTGPVFKYINDRYKNRETTVNFPFGAPFSAYFYADAPEIVREREAVRYKGKNNLILLKTKHLKDFKPFKEGLLSKEIELGRWVVLRRKS